MLNKNTNAYKNKLDYIVKYKKENTKNVFVTFYLNTEEDKKLFEFITEIGKSSSKTAYIKSLIKEDMKKRGF